MDMIILLLIFTLFTSSQGFLPFRDRVYGCAAGYSQYESSCYKVSVDFASYAAAEAQCAADGGTLAVPDDQQTHEHLKKLAAVRTASYWIGVRREKLSPQWFRSGPSKSNALKFTSWAAGEPSVPPTNDNCVIMLFTEKFHWVSTGCHYSFRYICQNQPAAKNNENIRCVARDLKEKHRVNVKGLAKTYQFGQNLTTSCEQGSATNRSKGSEAIATCGTNGAWTFVDPCLSTCSLPTDFPIGAKAQDKDRIYLHGDPLQLTCEDGYRATGASEPWKCLDNGTWAESPFKCLPDNRNVCPTPTYPEEEVVIVPKGEQDMITCLRQLRIEPRSVRTPSNFPTFWMKGMDIFTPGRNMSIDPADGSLLISSMSGDLEGLYTCVAEVGPPENVTFRSVRLTLDRPCRRPTFNVTPEDTLLSDAGFAVLRCSVNDKDSTVDWYRSDDTWVGDTLNGEWDAKVLGNGALLVRVPGDYQCVAKMKDRDDCESRRRVKVGNQAAKREVPTDICGRPKVKPPKDMDDSMRGKVVGGIEVVPGTHPWMALIAGDWKTEGTASRLRVFCGGSLVSGSHVVTAAHCFEAVSHLLGRGEDLAHLKVMLGKHDRVKKEVNDVTFTVSGVTVHPAFDRSSFDNDVAVVKLDGEVQFTAYILPICLPSKGFLETFMKNNRKASGIVAGWGQLQEEGARPLELREVRLPVVDERTCRRSTNETVTTNMFCAGYELETNDACKGDSGGPFEVEVQNIVYLAGIVSWGEGCGRPRTYGFYTKVERIEPFVTAVLERQSPARRRPGPEARSRTRSWDD